MKNEKTLPKMLSATALFFILGITACQNEQTRDESDTTNNYDSQNSAMDSTSRPSENGSANGTYTNNRSGDSTGVNTITPQNSSSR